MAMSRADQRIDNTIYRRGTNEIGHVTPLLAHTLSHESVEIPNYFPDHKQTLVNQHSYSGSPLPPPIHRYASRYVDPGSGGANSLIQLEIRISLVLSQ